MLRSMLQCVLVLLLTGLLVGTIAPSSAGMPPRPGGFDEKGHRVAAGGGTDLPPGVELAPGIDSPSGAHLPLFGTANLPVVLVQFPSQPGVQTPTAFFNMLFPIQTYPTGSMNDYYREQGTLSLWGTVLNWVTVSQPEWYYVNGFGGMLNTYPRNSQGLVREAILLADSQVDFRQFDNDGPDNIPNSGDDDGYVDCVLVVFSGYAAESYWPANPQNEIWSQTYRLSAGNGPGPLTVDGKQIDLYTIQSELRGTSGTQIRDVGVFCHEFGHALGLPDFYSTCPTTLQPVFGTSNGLGSYCLMGYGGWGAGGTDPDRPFHLSAFAKAYLGWVNVQWVTVDLPACPIPDVHTSRTVYANFPFYNNNVDISQQQQGFFVGLPPSMEGWIIENRQPTGFDARLPGAGLLVYHYDGSVATGDYNNNITYNWGDNAVAWSERRPLVDLECADQTGADHTLDNDQLASSTNLGDATDFFYLGNNTTFDATSTPSCLNYAWQNPIAIQNIGASGPVMTADLIVGVPGGSNHDVWVRDCPRDNGTVPSTPNCDAPYYHMLHASPDVWVDNNRDGVVDIPVPGGPNRLFAKVRNMGPQPVSYVDVYLYDMASVLALPAPVPPPPQNVYWKPNLIAQTTVQGLTAGDSAVVQVWWNVPRTTGPSLPPSVAVVVSTPNDTVGWSGDVAWENNIAVASGRELAHRAGHPAMRSLLELPPEPIEIAIPVNNPFDVGHEITVDAELDVVSGWDVMFEAEGVGPVTLPWTVLLPAFGKVNLFMQSIPPLGVPDGPAGSVSIVSYRTELYPLSEGILGSTNLPLSVDTVAPPEPLPVQCNRLRRPGCIPSRLVVLLRWISNIPMDERMGYYAIHRDLDPTFAPAPENLVAQVTTDAVEDTPEWEWIDEEWAVDPEGPLPYYRIVTVDAAGNESAPSEALYPTGTIEEEDIAAKGPVAITSIRPNPFGAKTSLYYFLPRPSAVRFVVYDVRGRLRAVLVDEVEAAGRHIVDWDGHDGAGGRLPAGVYIARLTSDEAVVSRKIVVAR